MSDYFNAVTSTGALRHRRPIPLCERGAKLPPGSSWTAEELATFRVVVKVTSRLHPLLLAKTADCDDFLSNPAIKDLLQVTPHLWGWTETDLVAEYGGPLGQFWAALTDPAAKRNRIAVDHAGMVESTTMQIGSSSPVQSSSQASSQDDAFVPADQARLMTREVSTQRLLDCFVRCALYAIPFDAWGKQDRIEVRTPVNTTVTLGGRWTIQAEDDGGLRRRPGPAQPSRTYPYGRFLRPTPLLDHSYDALFEAKRGFGQFENGRPGISDKWLGQMTAEALVGRLRRKVVYLTEYVFIIAAARSSVCFLCFEISDDYLEDIQEDEPTMVLPVTCTTWLDLRDYTERRYAAENIARLVRLAAG
ncbi:hypothetical protein GGR57DRAFT_439909 [Xylariaceae sp. FL1272]|nr:hypothetical protein GGR57DRAFT_439909 [Xylariaceae sp. FL1272]